MNYAMCNLEKPREICEDVTHKEMRSKIPFLIAEFALVDNVRIFQTIVNHFYYLFSLLICIYYSIQCAACQYHKSDYQSTRARG